MIVDLPHTTTSQVAKKLITIREEGGAIALGRVLTLIVATRPGCEEEAIEAANDASREHPMRVIVVVREELEDRKLQDATLDAQIRVGSDAGAGEVVVLWAHGEAASDEESLVTALLLPDAPVVTWWPQYTPDVPGRDPLGRFAARRITDASTDRDPIAAVKRLGSTYTPGDTDFAWTRLTLWREQLAAVLDQPPYLAVDRVRVLGAQDSPSTLLLAAWLQLRLQVPVEYEFVARGSGSSGIHGVEMHREDGTISLLRPDGDTAELRQPHQPTHELSLRRRSLRDCLAEELRFLAPDTLYGEVVSSGIDGVTRHSGVHAA